MAVSQFLDPIREKIQQVFVDRAAPDDEFAWEINLVPTMNECEQHGGLEIAAVFYATLGCPESGSRSTASLVLPMERLHHSEDLDEWTNDLWDKMVLNRMLAATSFDGAESDPTA